MKKAALLILLVLTLGHFASGQTTLTIGTISSCTGTSVCIPVTATNLNNVGGISLTLEITNPAAIDPTSFTLANINPELSNNGAVLFNYNPLTFRLGIIYFGGAEDPANIGTGQLFQICFNYYSGSTNFNCIQSPPTPCDISDFDGNFIAVTYNNGGISQSPVPDPAGLISGNATVCQGQPNVIYSVGAITNANSYNWVVPNGATIVSGQGTSSIVVDFGNTAISGNITVNGVNACGSGTSSSKAIVVDPLPGIPGAISGNTTFCQGTTQTFSIANVTYANTYIWTVPTGATITGASNGNTITVFFSNTAVSGNVTVRGENACGPGVTASTKAVIVQPMPTAIASGPAFVFNLQPAALTGSATGGTPPYTSWAWTPSGSVISPSSQNTLSTPLISNTTFCLVATDQNGCASDPNCVTVPIQGIPLSVLNIAATPGTICLGESLQLNVNANGGTGNYTYAWHSEPPEFTSSLQNPVFTPTQAIQYTLICVIGDGLDDVEDEVNIIVNPLPTVTQTALTPKCITAATFTLTSGSPAGGTYSGTGVSGGQFSPSVSGVGSFPVTYTYTDGNGCVNSATTNQVINALPIVNLAAFSPVCVGSASVTLTGGTPTPGTYTGTGVIGGVFNPAAVTPNTYTITYTHIDGNGCQNSATNTILVNPLPVVSINGTFDGQCVSSTAYPLSGGNPGGGTYSGPGVSAGIFNASLAGVSAGHTITYTYTDVAGCTSTSTGTIPVYALPTVTFIQPAAVCVDATPFSLSGGNPTGGTYSGTGVSSNTFNPSIPGVGATVLTYTYTDPNGCTNFTTRSITVNPLPTVSLGSLGQVCVSAPVFTLSGGLPPGGTYSGPGVDASNHFDPAQAGVGSHTITYTYKDGNNCVNSAQNTLIVNQLPPVTLPDFSDLCVSATPITLSGGLPVGGTYQGPGVTNNIFDPGVAGTGVHTITYTYTDGNGCTNDNQAVITVNMLPGMSLPAYPAVCISVSPYVLTGGTPAGGTYSGTGVSGGVFNPATAGAGTHTIQYSYTDANLCTGTITSSITVYALPVVSFPGTLTGQCVSSTSYPLSGGLPVGGVYTGTGVSGTNFNANTAGEGTHIITYTYTDVHGCINAATNSIVVWDLPTVTFDNLLTNQCISSTSYAVSGGFPIGGVYQGPGVTGTNFNAALAGVGVHTLKYTYTDGNGCVNFDENTIQVYNLPVVNFLDNFPDYCVSTTSVPLTGGTPLNGTYIGSGVSGTTFNPAAVGQGNHTITYSYTDPNGCNNTATATIQVWNLPTVTFPGTLTAQCESGTSYILSGGLPATGTYSGPGVVSSPVFNPSLAGDGTHTLTYTYIDNHGCSNTATNQIVVHPLPIANAGPNQNILNGIYTALSGSASNGSGSYTFLWSPADSLEPGGSTLSNPLTVNLFTTNVFTLIVTDQGTGCVSLPSQVTIFIEGGVLSVTASASDPIICVGESTQLNALGTGGNNTYTYTWAGPSGYTSTEQNPIVSPTATSTYTVSVFDGFNTKFTTVTITVNPLPVVTISPFTPAPCVSSTSFTLNQGSPAGGTYSGGFVTGTTFNPNAAGTGPHTINYSYTDGNGCNNSANGTITVNALPVVSFGGTLPNPCIDDVTTGLTGGTPSGGTYSGTGVSGTNFNAVTAGLGPHTLTYTYTDGNNCTNSATNTLTVNPLPVVTFTGPLTNQCISSTNYTLSGGLPLGGTYSGPGVSGGNFNASLAGSAGIKTITYTYTDGNGCTNSATLPITVYSLPVVSWTSSLQQQCVSNTIYTLSGATPPGGSYSGSGVTGTNFDASQLTQGTYTLTYTYTNANGCTNSATNTIQVWSLPVVNWPNALTPVCVSATTYPLSGGTPTPGTYSGPGVTGTNFNPTIAGVGTHTITYSHKDVHQCTNSTTNTITVNPLPTVTFPSPMTPVCSDAAAFALTTGTPAGGTYSGPGVSNGIFTPSAAGVGLHTITYLYADGNGCQKSVTAMQQVYALPNTVFNGTLAAQCVSSTTYTLTGGSPPGGTYSGPGVSGTTFNASLAGVGTHTITYTYQNPSTTCQKSATKPIVVNALPVLTWTTVIPDQCASVTSFPITGATPPGGTYSGPNVTGGVFNPSAFGNGTATITYTYTDGNNCTNSITNTIKVNALPVVTFPGTLTQQCIDYTSYTLTGGNPAGGTYSGSGVTSSPTFNASLAGGAGTKTITYTYVDPLTLCQNTATNTIVVNALPTVQFNGALAAQCISASNYPLTGGFPTSGTYSGPGVSGTQFNANTVSAGTHTLTYTYTQPSTGCVNSATNTILVNALPLVTFPGTLQNQCVSSTNYPLSGATPAGGTYQGTGVSGINFNASVAGVGNYTLTYSFTDVNGCNNSATNTIEVYALPVVTWPTVLADQCVSANTYTLSGGTPAGGIFTGTGVSGSNFNASLAGVGPHALVYTVTDVNNCVNSAGNSILVHELPVANAGTNIPISVGAFTTLNGSATGGSGSYSYLWSPADSLLPGQSTLPNPQTIGLYTTNTFTLLVTDNTTNCQSITDNMQVFITGIALNTIATVTDNEICIGTQVTLGTNTEGGSGNYTYSWTSVPAGFTSILASPSVFPVTTTTYTVVVDDGYVTKSSSIEVIVHPLPNTNFTSALPKQCINYPVYTLTQGSPGGGTYTGTGVSSPNFNPATAGIGTFTITYTYTDPNGCTKSATSPIIVNPLPNVTITGTYPDQCYNSSEFILTGGNPAGGTYSGNAVNNGIFQPAVAGIGTYPITYTFTDVNNCTKSDVENISVIFQPHITGFGTYDNLAGTPMDSIQLILQDILGNNLDTTVTAVNGEYYFRCLQNQTYQLVPSTESYPGGFNATDAMLTLQYSVGNISLSNLRREASDVNDNGATNALDALLIMRRFVGLNPGFPIGDWVFELNNPVAVTGNTTRDVKALCTGDVNGSYIPMAKSAYITPYTLVGQQTVAEGEEILVPVQASVDMNPAAISLVINLTGDELECTGIRTSLTNYEYHVRNGQLRFAWYATESVAFRKGQEVLSLVLRTRKALSRPVDALVTLSTETEIADLKGHRLDGAGFQSPQLIVLPQNGMSNSSAYMDIAPNPFNTHTKISIIQPKEARVRVYITDVYGRTLVQLMDEVVDAGRKTLDFNGSDLPPGTYLVRYETDNPGGLLQMTGKLMIIR